MPNVIGALAPIAGAYFGGPIGALAGSSLAGYLGGLEQNQENRNMSREQMDFQQRMSSTSYQRGVEDLKTAGLNPMLAYTQGGATTPGGASSTMTTAIGAGMHSAEQGQRTTSGLVQMQATQAGIEQTKAATQEIKSRTLSHDINTARAIAETANIDATRINTMGQQVGNQARSWREAYSLAAEFPKFGHHYRTGPDNGPGTTVLPADAAHSAFAADVARRKAESRTAETEAKLRHLKLPEARSDAQFYESTGQANPWLRQLFEILRGISGIKGR